MSYLEKEGLANSTIIGYLSVVSNIHISYGFPSPFDTSMQRLNQIMDYEVLKLPEETLVVTKKEAAGHSSDTETSKSYLVWNQYKL